jgi:hypothetical protein
MSASESSLPAEMFDDCRAVARNVPALERAARKAVAPAPSIRFEDFPTDLPKQQIPIDAAAVRLATALHLHLD